MTAAELLAAVAGQAAIRGLRLLDAPAATGFPVLVAGSCGVAYRFVKDDDAPLEQAEREWRDILGAAGADCSVWRPEDLAHGLIGAELGRLAGQAR